MKHHFNFIFQHRRIEVKNITQYKTIQRIQKLLVLMQMRSFVFNLKRKRTCANTYLCTTYVLHAKACQYDLQLRIHV